MEIAEIEREALKLPLKDLQILAARLDEAVAAQVDAGFETAAHGGDFDRIAEEALREYRAGTTEPLDDLLDEP